MMNSDFFFQKILMRKRAKKPRKTLFCLSFSFFLEKNERRTFKHSCRFCFDAAPPLISPFSSLDGNEDLCACTHLACLQKNGKATRNATQYINTCNVCKTRYEIHSACLMPPESLTIQGRSSQLITGPCEHNMPGDAYR